MKKHELDNRLLQNIKANIVKLKNLLTKVNDEWCYEDMIYRFYHHSFKVYQVQEMTKEIVDALKSLAPNQPAELNQWFLKILEEGSGKKWKSEHNQQWLQQTRPMIEAFLHAKFFLEMAVRYGKKLDVAPSLLPSGWASLLYLYNQR